MMHGRFKGLELVWFCQTPPAHHYNPRAINEGIDEVELIVSGYGHFEIGGSMRKVGPGSALWFAPGDVIVADTDPLEPYATLVFRFRCDESIPLARKTPFVFAWEDSLSCRRFCERAQEAFKLNGASDPDFGAALYSRMLWEQAGHLQREAKSERPASVEAALDFIERNCASRIGVREIAAAAGVSESHLHGLFAKHLGVGPFQQLLKARLERARALLAESNLTVKEVCAEIGFSELRNFCAYFKRSMGLTPGAYRRLAQGR